VSLPPVVPFTCQFVTEFVPPWTESWNCNVVATLTDAVAGEMVTLMLVVGSVHVEVEVEEELVDVEVVQVTAVLAVLAWWQEDRAKRARTKGDKNGRLTAPLS
jgi:hypothetical protein